MNLILFSAMSIVCMELSAGAQLENPIETPVEETVQEQTEAPVVPVKAVEPLAPAKEISVVETPAPLADAVIATPQPIAQTLAFEDKTDDEIVELVLGALENAKTLKGDFTQIAPSGAVSDGRFYLRRPGFLRFEYDPPNALLIVANGGVVYVRDDALETTDSYPVRRTPLKFLLRKKIDLDDAEVLRVDRGVDNVAVTLGSSDDQTEGDLTLIANADDLTLRRWIVRDAQNGSTVVSLTDVVKDEKLRMSLFRAPDAGGSFLKN